MKYLLLNGSPHKGNTWKLAELVRARIAQTEPGAEFRELHMRELGLDFCTGCSACFRLGEGLCPHRALVSRAIEDMDWADGIIVASTTYNLQPTSLLKNLFDHLCYMLHRPYFFTKKALVITSTGGVGAKKAAKDIASKLGGIGFNHVQLLAVSAYSWNDLQPDDKLLRRCARAADSFQAELQAGLRPARALNMIPYNMFRGMSLHYVAGTAYEYYDGEYWTDPVRAKSLFGPGVRVPFYKMPVGWLFFWLGKTIGRYVIVTYKK